MPPEVTAAKRWVPPKEWRCGLWQLMRQPFAQWEPIIQYTMPFVFAVKSTLAKLEGAAFEHLVTRPGVTPPQ